MSIMESNKDQTEELDQMCLAELDKLFFQVVLGQEQIKRLMDLPDYSPSLGDKGGWRVLKTELKKCYQIREAKINNQPVVALQLKAHKGAAIASGISQAEAAVKALILAHSDRYMTGQQLKEFRNALKTKSGRALTQTEFGKKIGNYGQQSQSDFERGRRPVPEAVARYTFQLFLERNPLSTS